MQLQDCKIKWQDIYIQAKSKDWQKKENKPDGLLTGQFQRNMEKEEEFIQADILLQREAGVGLRLKHNFANAKS